MIIYLIITVNMKSRGLQKPFTVFRGSGLQSSPRTTERPVYECRDECSELPKGHMLWGQTLNLTLKTQVRVTGFTY